MGKGFKDWLEKEKPDVVMLQEVKLSEILPLETIPGYEVQHWNLAKKRGYSGVATLSRTHLKPLPLLLGDDECDTEGRLLALEGNGIVWLNGYFPNSQRDHARLPYKLRFCNTLIQKLDEIKKKYPNVILAGDLNIAHKEIDLKNPKTNMNNAGFLPQERAWMDKFLSLDYVDVFRHYNQKPDQYTWWSYRPGVREKNIGWRLDYFICSKPVVSSLMEIEHQPHILGSDHCPVVLKLKD